MRDNIDLLDTTRHRSITLHDGNSFDDEVEAIISRLSNLAAGLCWYYGLSYAEAKSNAGFIVHVMLLYLDIPKHHHNNMVRYMIDSAMSIYYFHNGDPRSKPTIYAEKPFTRLTRV